MLFVDIIAYVNITLSKKPISFVNFGVASFASTVKAKRRSSLCLLFVERFIPEFRGVLVLLFSRSLFTYKFYVSRII